MGKIKDLMGQKFGMLTVLQISPTKKFTNTEWICMCDCGKLTTVVGSSLTRGVIKSCGCQQGRWNFQDLTGLRFGRLVVLQQSKNKGKRVCWLCLCDCGQTTVVSGMDLKRKATKSCGCLRKETNTHNLTGLIFGRLTVLSQASNSVHGGARWHCICECGKAVIVRGNSLVTGNTLSCGCFNRSSESKLHGEHHPAWKNGTSKLGDLIKNLPEYRQWRLQVFERDNYTCLKSGIKTYQSKLTAHHIYSFRQILKDDDIQTVEDALACDSLWDVSNGATLLPHWHATKSKNKFSFHRMYGTKYFTPKQFYEWLKLPLTTNK